MYRAIIQRILKQHEFRAGQAGNTEGILKTRGGRQVDIVAISVGVNVSE
jgi:hypothetical protein